MNTIHARFYVTIGLVWAIAAVLIVLLTHTAGAGTCYKGRSPGGHGSYWSCTK